MKAWTLRLGAASLFAVVVAIAPSSFAGEPSEGDMAAARSLADTGFERFGAGSYAEAFERFESAEKLFHAPPHLLFMARSKAKLGELIAARTYYQSLVQETLPADAPPAFADFQTEGQKELAELEARIPKLNITITGVGPGEATVTVDGATVDASSTLYLASGEHRVVAQAAGFDDATQTVTLAEGATESMTLSFGADSSATPPASVDEPDTPRSPPNLVPPGIVLGVGGVGLLVGTITGIVAMGKASDLDAACPDRARCAAENESLEDSARTFGTVSTISFVAGGLCVAGGVAWLLYELSGSDEGETAFVRPVVLGNEVGLGLSF